MSSTIKALALMIFISTCSSLTSWAQTAQHREAKRMYKLLTGTFPDGAVLEQMASLIAAGTYASRYEAAVLATRSADFYLNTLVPFGNSFTDPTDTPYPGLNQGSAFLVGMTISEEDTRTAMLASKDFYIGSPLIGNPSPSYGLANDFDPCTSAQANTQGSYCNNLFFVLNDSSNNSHYSEVEKRYRTSGENRCHIDQIWTPQSPQGCLRRMPQQILDGPMSQRLTNEDAAGFLTTYTWAKRVYFAGTIRRPIQEIFKLFLCTPLSQARDPSVDDSMVARDVTRAPAGDVARFNECRSCHGIIDSFRPAFARYTWNPPENLYHEGYFVDQRFTANYTANPLGGPGNPSGLNGRVNHNELFYPNGYYTNNRNWVNNAIFNQNVAIGWHNVSIVENGVPRNVSYLQGTGAHDLGLAFGHTDAFGRCMAKRVFTAVCKRDLSAAEEPAVLNTMLTTFSQNGYKFRSLWGAAAANPACFVRE